MSSILDALKKLEAEKEEKEPDFTWPQSVNTRLTLSEQLKRPYSHRLLMGIGGLLFLLVSVAFLLAGPDRDRKKDGAASLGAEKKAALAQEAVQKTETLEDAMAFDETVQRPPATERTAAEDEGEIPEDAMAVDKESQSGIDALASLVSGKKPSGIFGNGPSAKEKPAPSDKVAQVAEFDRKASDLIRKIPKNLVPPVKTVASNWLTLHAISWSSNPINRIAVINSQIVREGRRIEGGLVKRIDKDYVVIEKDGEDLMLPFGR